MVDDNSTSQRRNLLKSIAGAGALVCSTGISAAKTEEMGNLNESRGSSGSASSTVQVSSENSRSPEEFDEYRQQAAEEHGPDIAAMMDPGSDDSISIMSRDPGEKKHLKLRDFWEKDFKVWSDQTGANLLTTTHLLNMYEADGTDSDGRNVYVFWQWSQSEGKEGWWHPAGKTELIRNWLDLKDDKLKLMPQEFSPQTAHDVNGSYVRVGVNVGLGDIEAGLSKSIYVKQGELAPETSKLDFGNAGSFSVTWKGCRKGTTNALGTTVIRTHEDLGSSIPNGMLEWHLFARGNSNHKCSG